MNFDIDNFDAIIGFPILKELGAQINLADNILIINNRAIELSPPESYPPITCYHKIDNPENKFQKFRLDHLNKEEYQSVTKLLRKYDDIFYNEGDQLTFTNQIKHHIRTRHEDPIYSKNYRYPIKYKEEVDEQIKDLLNQGIIRHSTSPYSAPIWIVPKKLDASGKPKFRLVVDYRKLNEITIPDRYPIPNIDDILDKMGRAMYFTTVDLSKGFNQIEVNPADIPKTAFSTSSGHYEWLRMPFGLTSAPSTFQRLMNNVLAEHIGKIAYVYLDDIIIFSTSLQEHIDSLNKIFATLRAANLKVQLDKTEFLKRETEYLGHIISEHGIKPNPKKTNAVHNFPIPKTQKQIRQFLGLAGFYRKFIKDFSAIARPMTRYLKKDVKVNILNNEYIESFTKLKTLLTSDPILIHPDFNKEFVLTTDASNVAIGAVLSQNDHPICYASRTLNEHEINYAAYEKELLAIVWATRYFRPYLYGNKFKIRSDHKPLQWLHNVKDPNSRVLRWKIRLSEYNYTIEHVKGKDNVVADCLSRPVNQINAYEMIELKADKKSKIVVLTSEVTSSRSHEIEATSVIVEPSINTRHSADEDNSRYLRISLKPINLFKKQFHFELGNREKIIVTRIHGKTKKRLVTSIFNEEYFTRIIKSEFPHKGTVAVHFDEIKDFHLFQITYKKLISPEVPLKVYQCSKVLDDILNEATLQEIILKTHLKANHRGIAAVYYSLKESYYWPDLKREITKVINNCTTCNTSKYDRHALKLPFKKTHTPKECRELYQTDIWQSDTKNYYLTCIDVYSKYAQVYKLSGRNWIDVKNGLINIFNTMGKPQIMKTDVDPGLHSINLKNWLSNEGVVIEYTTSKTGIADIERFHGSLNEHLRVLKTRDDITGVDLITMALYYYNTTYHSTIENIPQTVHLNNVDISTNLQNNKDKMLKRANKGRKEDEINTRFIPRPRVRKLDNPKRIPHRIEKINEDHYKEIRRNNVEKRLYKSNFARRKKFTESIIRRNNN